MIRRHEPVEGVDFMPSGWCGGCEACGRAAEVCGICSYNPVTGEPRNPVAWPCPIERAARHLDGPRNCPRCSKARTQLIGGIGDNPAVIDYCQHCNVAPEEAWL